MKAKTLDRGDAPSPLPEKIALILQEAAMALPEQLRGARAALREMSPDGRARLEPLLAHLAGDDADEMFAFTADRTIDALTVLVERR